MALTLYRVCLSEIFLLSVVAYFSQQSSKSMREAEYIPAVWPRLMLP